MKPLLQPWQLPLLILAGWINYREQDVIEYLRAENRMFREKLGKKRILLNADQRRRLAVKGKILGRKMLEQVATIVTPDTILRWHRELVAAKWDYSERRKKIGCPPASAEVVELVLRMARENPGWGYDRIPARGSAQPRRSFPDCRESLPPCRVAAGAPRPWCVFRYRNTDRLIGERNVLLLLAHGGGP